MEDRKDEDKATSVVPVPRVKKKGPGRKALTVIITILAMVVILFGGGFAYVRSGAYVDTDSLSL